MIEVYLKCVFVILLIILPVPLVVAAFLIWKISVLGSILFTFLVIVPILLMYPDFIDIALD